MSTSGQYDQLRVYIEGWRLPIVLACERDSYLCGIYARDLGRFIYPYPSSLSLCIATTFIGEGLLGEIIGSLSFADVKEQSEKSKNFKEHLPPLKALAAFLSGFLFIGWGWGWWKGIYHHPYGASGYILASFACIMGVVLWWLAINWGMPF
jgi:hypothetical protein